MRVVIVSLSTYTAPYNDGKLRELGSRLEALSVVSGDTATLWGHDTSIRSGAGYEVAVLPLRSTRTYATARLVGLDEIVNNARPTLIHVECEPWQAVAVQCLKLAQSLRVPIGVQFAECGPRLRGAGGALRRARGARVLKQCDFAVGWSEASTRIARQLAPGIRTDTFPATGVPLVTESAVPTEQWFGPGSAVLPKLAFVGRFAAEKGITDFLRICDDLARRLPVRVALAGGDGTNEEVSRWASQRPWVYPHGIVPRPVVASLLSEADVLVCPSRTTRSDEEQFGKAAVEAMSVGTPVFAYDCGALAEVIGNGGVVVPEGEQSQLTERLESHFVGSVADRATLGREARARAALFTDDTLAVRLVELWSTCAGQATEV